MFSPVVSLETVSMSCQRGIRYDHQYQLIMCDLNENLQTTKQN